MIRFMYRAVDVMSFAGGFTLGMTQAGFDLVGKRELKGGFGVPSCESNRHLLGNNWHSEVGSAESWTVPAGGADVVFGNPPCSGWSVMSAKHFRGADSPALSCTWAFVDYVARAQPTIGVFESVQQAFTHADGLATMRALRERLEERTGKKWFLYHVRHNAYSVGGCAKRPRYFWVASQVPFGVEIPTPANPAPTFYDVISDLTDFKWRWTAQPYSGAPVHPWTRQLLSPSGCTDGHIGMDNPLTRRLSDIMAGVPWNPGEAMATVVRRYYNTHGRLPESWSATEEKILKSDFMLGFTTPTRWRGDNAARVITGGSMQLVIHPTQDRMITHRECARVLGFPDNWLIEPMKSVSGLHMTWGKGISVHCGRWIGEWIKKSLDGDPGTYIGTPMGEREWDINVTNTWKRPDSHISRITNVVQYKSCGQDMTVPTPSGRKIMTEPTPAATPAPTAGDDTTPRRGRPRPEATIERDKQVLTALGADGKTREDLVTTTGLTKSEIYLSLHRLRKDGLVERTRNGGKHLWVQTAPSANQAEQNAA